MDIRTVSGVQFLRLILQHILPKGFRRARNYGFLHPNSQRKIVQLQLQPKMIFKPYQPIPRPIMRCVCCGGEKSVLARRIKPPQQPKASVGFAREGGAQQGLGR